MLKTKNQNPRSSPVATEGFIHHNKRINLSFSKRRLEYEKI